MSQTNQLITTLKRLLKSGGITYAQIASHLKLSEASVKRQFSQQTFSLKTLESICDLLQLEMIDLIQASELAQAKVSQLTREQEAELVSDPRRVLVAICALNHLTMKEIVSTYRLSEAVCITHLLRLEHLGMIRLMPGNRVKLRIARGFAWLPGGPIYQFFRDRAQTEFLSTQFNQPGDFLRFQHAMLSPADNIKFQQRLNRLLQEFTDLHEQGVGAPVKARYGTSLLLAMRPWEPTVFEELRRAPDTRAFRDGSI